MEPKFTISPELKDMMSDEDIISENDGTDILMINPNNLVPYVNNPFKLYTGKKLEDLINSIKDYGILQPILARPLLARINENGEYEILAGHNRHNVAKILKLSKVPVRILENIDDITAELIVSESNMLQRSLADLAPSERAFIISTHYNAQKRQGHRTDLDKIDTLVSGIENINDKKIDDFDYSMSTRNIARYCRLDKLSNSYKEKLDNHEIDMRTGVELSYLTQEEQDMVASVSNELKIKVNQSKAKELRKLAHILDREKIESILSNKSKREKSIMIKRDILKEFFTDDDSDDTIIETVRAALSAYTKGN